MCYALNDEYRRGDRVWARLPTGYITQCIVMTDTERSLYVNVKPLYEDAPHTYEVPRSLVARHLDTLKPPPSERR